MKQKALSRGFSYSRFILNKAERGRRILFLPSLVYVGKEISFHQCLLTAAQHLFKP